MKGVEFHAKVLSFIDVHWNQILQDMNGVGDGALALIGLKLWHFREILARKNANLSHLAIGYEQKKYNELGGRSTSTCIVTAVICSAGTFKNL